MTRSLKDEIDILKEKVTWKNIFVFGLYMILTECLVMS